MRLVVVVETKPLVVALALVAACSGDAAEDVRPEALFGGASLADTPWPSDAFLSNGRVKIETIPLPGQTEPLAALAAALSELDGAPVYTSVFFPTRGALPNGRVRGTGRFVDLDVSGSAFEGELFFRAATSELVVLPPAGRVLVEGHKYAVIVECPDVRPSAEMRATFGSIAPVASGRDVAAATVFTVGRPSQRALAMRDVAAKLPAPTARVDRLVQGAELDDFFGRPQGTRPALGNAGGVVHDAIDAVVLGSYDGPSFLSANAPRLGRIALAADGVPLVKGSERIPFMLTIPKGATMSNLPVLVFQHGLNAGRWQVASAANSYARAGYATIGIDALFHGSRHPSLRDRDESHNFSGAAGPDGLADGDAFGAAVILFDFGGDAEEGIVPLDARVVRDNLLQAVVDLSVFARFVREGDMSAIAATDARFAGFAFERDSLAYTGESFGAVIGMGGVAIAPEFHTGVLSAGGGAVFLGMIPSSPTFRGLVTPFFRTSIDSDLEIGDPETLPGEAQKSLALVQAAIGPGDPVTFAPVARARKKNVLLLVARSDELIPNQASELLAGGLGATSVSLPAKSAPLRFVELPAAAAPFEASPTIAVVQLDPALHDMFTSHRGQRRYEKDFPPFLSLPAPVDVASPTELAHALAIGFARPLRTGGVPRVEALAE